MCADPSACHFRMSLLSPLPTEGSAGITDAQTTDSGSPASWGLGSELRPSHLWNKLLTHCTEPPPYTLEIILKIASAFSSFFLLEYNNAVFFFY